MEHLWTPWRMKYVTADKGEKKMRRCVFCHKQNSHSTDPQDYIVARSEYVYVVLNIFPYSGGHVMVVPYEHLHSQEQFSTPALTDLMLTVNRTLKALRYAYNPPGFNLGANLGEAAGAGIAAHYHFHIVPRWDGDANFMTVIGDTRVIPNTLDGVYANLIAAYSAIGEGS